MQQAKQICNSIFCRQQHVIERLLFWAELVQVGFLSCASEMASIAMLPI